MANRKLIKWIHKSFLTFLIGSKNPIFFKIGFLPTFKNVKKIMCSYLYSTTNYRGNLKIMQCQPYKLHGFSLLEMLVVLVIIGLLAGLVGPRIFGTIEPSKVKTANVQIKMLKAAVGTMYLDIGRYPTTEESLAILRTEPADETIKPFWKGPYLEEALPLDPWNHPYQYSVPGGDGHPFALYSFGADGRTGGLDYNADIGYLLPKTQQL